ncbi:ribosomal large subunit pseudouridine synthase B [bacterium BMS3Abin02]|nr:ribosomal large subunit pseudouridine synthase B [bacterium BMS3Abin02]GBE20804.1 ribosomal large subunit pseudouridine synthase B [bacterium BMS3Bbin01]
MNERLQKLIAHSGLTSRRGAEELIRQGRVTVDGTAAHLGQKIDPEQASVLIDGVPLPVAPGLVYYLLNKPPGVVSTASDPQGRRTVVEIVGDHTRLYPVGRLDVDSEGLLILTNDGDLAHLLMHPRFEVAKTYTVLVGTNPTARQLRDLREGVELEDGPAAALSARVIDRSEGQALIEIVMGEGRKREVRRMCGEVGLPVLRLVRTAIGPLRDRSLRPGSFRSLTIEEVRNLYGAAIP